MPALSPYYAPIILLMASNIFMIFAWYGHLNFKSLPLWQVVMISWLIALPEYWLAVPANRLGHGTWSAAELKTIQEVLTLIIFSAFSVFYLKEPLYWNHLLGFFFIALGAFFVFYGRN